MMFNPLTLDNVFLPQPENGEHITKDEVRASYELDTLRSLLWELACIKPTWQFRIRKFSMQLDSKDLIDSVHYRKYSLVVKTVIVHCDDERLGSISVGYHGRTKKLVVENDRIKDSRSGRNGGKLLTSDPKRALREILKNFYAKKPEEQMSEALGSLRDTVFNVYRKIDIASKGWTHAFDEAASQFLRSHPELLYSFPNPDVHKNKALDAIEKLKGMEDAKNLYNSIAKPFSDLSAVFANKMANNAIPDNVLEGSQAIAIVIADGSEYIIHYKGETNRINSSELPEELRASMGMLKLAEPNTIHSGLGMYHDNRFIVMASKGEDDAA